VSIRVLIADDHPVVRDGLRLTIHRSAEAIEVVGEASNGVDVLAMAGELEVDVYVLDILMPAMNGIEAMKALLARDSSARVLILSLHDTPAMINEALASGARGYLTKAAATGAVVQAITAIHAGRRFLGPLARRAATRRPAPPLPTVTTALSRLTQQESRVLQLVGEGCSTKEIAGRLRVSTNTAHVHLTRLMAKLNIHSRAQLVRYAIKSGATPL
jgi:DNA-binding NarL/FixJ family response regulator